MAAKKQVGGKTNEKPTVVTVEPAGAIPGGELYIRGTNLARLGWTEDRTDGERGSVEPSGAAPTVYLGRERAHLVVAGNQYIVARVPESATVGEVVVHNGEGSSEPAETHLGIQIADGLHPVANPAIDDMGNVYTTFSGSRGQKSPVSIFRVDTNYNTRPFVTDLMNPTGLAIDREGVLYASSRFDGVVYQINATGQLSVYVEGMGVATGLAFDPEGNLFVGDRSGTIFKISRSRQIYVFATLEPSIAAYHLAYGPDGYLYVTGPTTSSFDSVHRISQAGEVDVFFRGLGRPQGLSFDREGNLYVAASLGGRRGVVRIDKDRRAKIFFSGPGIVGLAFSPSRAILLTTQNALFRVDAGISGYSVHA